MQFRWKMRCALRDDAADTGGPHRRGHVLARGARAEVLAGGENGVARQPAAQRRVQALEEVLRHLGVVEDVEVGAGIEDVRVDVVLGDEDGPALDDHVTAPEESAGSTISPATAAAAATHALARYTSAS